jgi:hypothetical protein
MRVGKLGSACALLISATVCAAETFPERQVMQGEGYRIEYSVGDENYANALVRHLPLELPANRRDASMPLTVTDLRARREQILAFIAENLALPAPTPKMTQTFDAFGTAYTALQSLGQPRPSRFALWRKPELAARLAAGQNVEGLTRTADGEIAFSLGVSFELREGQRPEDSLARVREDLAALTWPIKIGEDGTASVEIEKRLDELRENAAQLGAFQSSELQRLGVVTVLHETVESTLVDAYIRSADRRWFCEGVANYVAYRTLESLLGAEAARAYYDVNAEVARYVALRDRVDLAHWRVMEDPKSRELPVDVNTASYAFATKAVFDAFGSGDPHRLAGVLSAVRKTPIEKATIQTVYAAYQKRVGKPLAGFIGH